MADIKSAEERSKNMAAIRSKGTKPEIYFRKLLFAQGYRYRVNVNHIVGCPDLFLTKYNTAIFIHGCFWHRHANCRYAYNPKSSIDFWKRKFDANITRDCYVCMELRSRHIKCLIIWECTIKKMQKDPEIRKCMMARVSKFIQSDELYMEIANDL